MVCSPYRSSLSDTLMEHHSWYESGHNQEDRSNESRKIEGDFPEKKREKAKKNHEEKWGEEKCLKIYQHIKMGIQVRRTKKKG